MMMGAIAGDIIGSRFEFNPIKTTNFEIFTKDVTFTDDTVLTIAIANAIIEKTPYVESVKKFARMYPNSGFGGFFKIWMLSDSELPYNSWGNGSAMRVSPVGFAFDDLETVLDEARKSAAITHDHPEGIKGAQATAASVFLAKSGQDKDEIKKFVESTFGYDLSRSVEDIRPTYRFDVSCQGSVPQSIIAFLESANYEDAVRLSISMGGDADTMACITGGIAEAYYKTIPDEVVNRARNILDAPLRKVLDRFIQMYF